MIKRWLKNIKWLFNSPPTSITQGKILNCDYCGARGDWECVGSGVRVAFCFNCLKKALDKALKEKK